MSNISRKIKRNKNKNKNKNNYTKQEIIAVQVPEYYTFVFAKILEEKRDILEKNYVKEFHKDFFKNKVEKELSGEEAWDLIKSYSENIEIKLKEILEQHSISFWMQLYRRVGLGIVSDIERRTDETTIYQLRDIVETAITKFSKIDGKDIQNTQEITDEDILGGLFKKYYSERFKDNYNEISKLILSKNHQVITDFNENDYIAIYIIERFSHEYWWATAVMRSVGKGACIYRDDKGIIQERRTASLQFLIENYDNRIKDEEFTTSNIGISFFQKKTINQMLTPQYNYKNLNMTEVNVFLKFIKSEIELDMIPNFIWGIIDIGSFLETYKFLDDTLIKKLGFSVSQISIYLYIISLSSFINTLDETNTKPNLIRMMNLYQRAYIFNEDMTSFKKNIFELFNSLQSELNLKDVTFNEQVIEVITEYLTLDKKQKQQHISLWSSGPKYVFFKSNNLMLINFLTPAKILKNLFFGVRVNTEKGEMFEDNFRTFVEYNKLNLLPNRKIENIDGKEREIDLAIRVKNTLFLLECRAIEKPLDFEIGKIRTLTRRKEELDSKLEQVLTLAQFIQENKKGKNYDFTWVENIEPIVVTPFIEWIASTEEKYWINNKIPRILNPEEVIKIIKKSLK